LNFAAKDKLLNNFSDDNMNSTSNAWLQAFSQLLYVLLEPVVAVSIGI